MSYFLQQTINGLTLGCLYGLIALGYTMVYGIIGMINFAHGEIYMIGAFVSLIFFTLLGLLGITWVPLAILLVLLLAILFTSAYGWAVERIAYRPLRGSFRLSPLISAIGMSIFLQNYVQLLQGARLRTLPVQISGSISLFEIDNFVVQITYMQIAIVLLTVVLMFILRHIISNTRLGRSQRACEQDREMSGMLGIPVDQTISYTFVIGAGLAAVAGMMVTLYYGSIDFFMGFLAGIKAFTAAVLGGVGSIPGAMLGGIFIGLIEAYWGGYVSGAYKDVAVFAVLILVLTVMPTGFLGRPEIQKV
jgi:branched-chain amino acid transport system permease protein